MRSNIDLCDMAQKALNENWGYCLGGFGTILTDTLLKAKCNQAGGVGEYNTKHLPYLKTFRNKRVSDCIGIIKACVWWDNTLHGPKYSSATDRGTQGLLTKVKEFGPMEEMPNIKGLVVYMTGHVGVYMGDNVIIECAGAPKGMLRSTKVNGVWKGGSKFTHWLKYPDIDYTSESKPAVSETPSVKAETGVGKVKMYHKPSDYRFEVDGVNINGVMYVAVRQTMTTYGYEVGWESDTNTVTTDIK